MSVQEMFNEALPGETYLFHYNGGSEGAGFRLCRFQSMEIGANGAYIDTWDLEKKAIRRFSVPRINGVRRVAHQNEECILPQDFLAVDVEKLGSATIIDVYKRLYPQAKGVKWDDNARCIIVVKPEEPQVSVDIYGAQVRVRFINREGQILDLRFQAAQNIGVVSIGCKLKEDDAKKFATVLYDHFNYEMKSRSYYSKDLNLSPDKPEWKELKDA